jgi:sugar lactone lactonase YvrE
MKKIILGIAAILVILILIFFLKPAPIDAVTFTPPEAPEFTGVLAPNNTLQEAELLALGQIIGPEEVAVDSSGRVYGGTEDGKIIRVLPDGSLETFVETGGRPLGMKFDESGNLIVCDPYKGLLSIDPQGEIKTLATSVDGVLINFADALDISSDGIIYFSDASTKYDLHDDLYGLLESKAYGRFLTYDPATGEVRVLLEGLYFANGVALSPEEDFVLINETYRYKITRYWLKGPNAGTHEIFVDNLPGFPDNISVSKNGTFWVALFTIRNEAADKLHPFPTRKNLLAKVPPGLWPKPKPYGLVIELDAEGNIIQSLHDPTGENLKEITSAQEYGDYLYLGSLHNDRIGKYKLP